MTAWNCKLKLIARPVGLTLILVLCLAGMPSEGLTSADRIKFTEVVSTNLPGRFTLYSVAFWKDGRFVAVGQDIVLTSGPNGTWATTSKNTSRSNLRAVAAGKEQLVAVGDRGTILVSSNAVDWAVAASNVTNTLNGVTWSGALWMAVGMRGTVVTSTNGLEWTDRSPAELSRFHLVSVAYGGGRFVAVGATHLGYAFSSTDGADWTVAQVLGRPIGVTYGNGRFVALIPTGLTHVSTDGVNWSMGCLCGRLPWTAKTITYGRGRFLAAVNVNGDGVLSSADGIHWVRDFTLPSMRPNLTSIAYGDGRYVCVGFLYRDGYLYSVIFQAQGSAPYIDQLTVTNGIASLSFSGGTAARYRAEAATDPAAANWTVIGEVSTVDGLATFEDTNASKFERRVYRVIGLDSGLPAPE